MNYYFLAGCLLMVGLLVGCQPGEKKTLSDKGENVFPVSTHRALNPIAPPGVFIADPEVRQMPDGRVYIYGWSNSPLPPKGWGSRSTIPTGFCLHPTVSIGMENTISIIAWPEVGKMKVLPFLLLLMVRSGMGR